MDKATCRHKDTTGFSGASCDASTRSQAQVGKAGRPEMKARLLDFGSIEVDGLRYEHDIVIDGGTVRKRKKKPSKPYRSQFGHTPLSADEELPWRGSQLIIGTGA